MAKKGTTKTHWNQDSMSDAEKTAFDRGRSQGKIEGVTAVAVVVGVLAGIGWGISALPKSCESGRTDETEVQQAENERNARLSGIDGKQAKQKQEKANGLEELIAKASDKTLKGSERKKALEKISTFETKDKEGKEAIRSLMEKMALDPNRQVNKEAMDYILRGMEPRRALNVFLTAINTLDANSAWEAAVNIGTMTREGKVPSSKEEIRRGLERIIQAQNKFQFSKERMAPACIYTLKEIKLEWNNMLWKQNAANTTSSLMRPPKAMRDSSALPREVNPAQRNYATRRMG